MTRVRVDGLTISLDGYGAGPQQDLSNPLGLGGADLHQWLFPTRTSKRTLFGKDGTTFHCITSGIHEALDSAHKAAAGRDVRIGGGPQTIQQYLRGGLIDELHLAIAPALLGSGERHFEGLDMRALCYECVEMKATEKPRLSCPNAKAIPKAQPTPNNRLTRLVA